jgi:ATP-dependent protease ClpP protease subunit
MIIHPIRMNGLIIGVPQTFDYFNKMQERINEFIARNSKIDKADLHKLMLQTDELLNDMGTILIGNQAVEYGIIDEVGGISNAISKLEELISIKASRKNNSN